MMMMMTMMMVMVMKMEKRLMIALIVVIVRLFQQEESVINLIEQLKSFQWVTSSAHPLTNIHYEI